MRRITIHKRSSVANQMPASLEYGEIAVNYSANNEFLSVKNSNNNIVIFPASGIITTAINAAVSAETVRATSAETILQTNITNEATARGNKDTELETAINEYKLTVAAALNELQNRTTSLESRVTALEP